MCGHCVEMSIIDSYHEFIEKDEQDNISLLFHTGMSRLRKKGIPPPDRDESPDKKATVIFFLREGEPYSHEDDREKFALPKSSDGSELSIIISEKSHLRSIEILDQWYAESFPQKLNNNWPYSFFSDDQDHIYWSLLLCTQVRRAHDPQWLNLMERLSGNWMSLPAHVFGEETSWSDSAKVPLPDDTRLWLRMEARNALWNAGCKELALAHDEEEPYSAFQAWKSAFTTGVEA